jgi:DNA ligase-1
MNDDWKEITYMVYDAPGLKGNFSERLNIIEKNLKQNNSKHCVYHKQIICKSVEHLDSEMQKVVNLNGEGLMIKDPKSKYEGKRSGNLLKVKEF